VCETLTDEIPHTLTLIAF